MTASEGVVFVPFCSDCPDHEACSTGWSCWMVRELNQYLEERETVSEAIAKEICEHNWTWISPAGTNNFAHLCSRCHQPDPDWLNSITEVERDTPIRPTNMRVLICEKVHMDTSHPSHVWSRYNEGDLYWCRGLTDIHTRFLTTVDKEEPMAQDIQLEAKHLIVKYVNAHLEKTDGISIGMDDVYVVWFAKTLQNWKVMISTVLPDGMYYEVTHNGDNMETYIDAYKKFDNVAVPD